jgi:hypothetical protein
MSKPNSEQMYVTSDGREITALMAGTLLGIVHEGGSMIVYSTNHNQALSTLETQGCLTILWEDDTPYEVEVTEYGKGVAAELEAQEVTPISLQQIELEPQIILR